MTKKPRTKVDGAPKKVPVTKEFFISQTEKKPVNLLTNERHKELLAEWEMYYENPSMRGIVYKNIQSLTQQILDGQIIVEKPLDIVENTVV